MIVARRVNIGQTVAGGSLYMPSMFLIAKDLSKMQVRASVNEADIGKIRSRKDARQFTADAYRARPSRKSSPDPLGRQQHAKRGHLYRGRGFRILTSD